MTACARCNDTHQMPFGEERRLVMCTACPRPCHHCQDGRRPYCKRTPCICSCHGAAGEDAASAIKYTALELADEAAARRRLEALFPLNDAELANGPAYLLNVAASEIELLRGAAEKTGQRGALERVRAACVGFAAQLRSAPIFDTEHNRASARTYDAIACRIAVELDALGEPPKP